MDYLSLPAVVKDQNHFLVTPTICVVCFNDGKFDTHLQAYYLQPLEPPRWQLYPLEAATLMIPSESYQFQGDITTEGTDPVGAYAVTHIDVEQGRVSNLHIFNATTMRLVRTVQMGVHVATFDRALKSVLRVCLSPNGDRVVVITTTILAEGDTTFCNKTCRIYKVATLEQEFEEEGLLLEGTVHWSTQNTLRWLQYNNEAIELHGVTLEDGWRTRSSDVPSLPLQGFKLGGHVVPCNGNWYANVAVQARDEEMKWFQIEIRDRALQFVLADSQELAAEAPSEEKLLNLDSTKKYGFTGSMAVWGPYDGTCTIQRLYWDAEDRRLALAMSRLKRLGGNSPLWLLGDDNLEMIRSYVVQRHCHPQAL